jgi:hypothetical protein
VKRYTYYYRDANGQASELYWVLMAEQPTQMMLDNLHDSLVAQHGPGVPRPQWFSVTELHDMPPRIEIARAGAHIDGLVI